MEKTIREKLQQVKNSCWSLMAVEDTKRQQVLISLAEQLRNNTQEILEENAKDLALMHKEDPQYDRLLLTEERLQAIADDVIKVALLPTPLNQLIEEKNRPNGLRIQKRTVPLGVVAVIYESRPNVTVDVFSLCFKSGNACVLKGGKEACYSNRILVKIIHQVVQTHGLDPDILYSLPLEREATLTLLNSVGLIDVCIPRGSQGLINYVRDHAKVPVIETGAGIVHAYFDASGDLEKGQLIVDNAKTRRVSVCNALDTLIIHKQQLTCLGELVKPLATKNVEIFADETSYHSLKSLYPATLLKKATPEDFGQEFLSYKMSIKTVSSIQEAINHIRNYTSGHSETIIAEDEAAISLFLMSVDAAAVYVNASTAFTDGGEFGLGAEIGISTQKLHARGPMALEALTSYKWIIFGDGHIRT